MQDTFQQLDQKLQVTLAVTQTHWKSTTLSVIAQIIDISVWDETVYFNMALHIRMLVHELIHYACDWK